MDPLNELWKIDVGGNWAEKLNSLQKEISETQVGWERLSLSMTAAGAKFKTPAAEMRELSKEARNAARDAEEAAVKMEKVADEGEILGRAYSSQVKEVNKLNTVRARELAILERTKEKQDPLILQMRAEAGAIQRVTRALKKQLEDRRFLELAKEAGLQVEEKQVKVFNAEADALERIEAAAKRAAVAKELQARGFDAQGNLSSVVEGPSIPDSFNGALTAEGRAKAADAANARLAKLEADNLTKSKLLQNQAYIDGVKRSKELRQQMDELTKSTDATESASNRFLFTFRRLIGVMALFTVARVVTRGFTDMVKGAIRFQAEIESTRVGLSGLIAASAEIRTPSGGRLGIDDQLLLSQQIAIDQMNKLRIDALQTAASYDELARAFQNAVAPGIQSGLTLDQIRKVTVNISQAATGLGLAQDQLAEEIRSLFTGAISARNTRIATALGITPADIARAKQLGTLFEFLDQRFQAISKTGKLLMNTFTGQLSNAADAFKQLLASSSTPLFEQLKASLADLQKAIFTTTKDAVQLDPQTLSAFRQLFQGLAQGVASVRAAFSKLDLTGFAIALGTLGQGLGLAMGVIANAIVLVSNAVNPVLGAFKLLISLVNTVVAGVRGLPTPVQQALGLVTSLAAKFLVFSIAARKSISAWIAIAGALKKIRDYAIVSTAAANLAPGPLRLINTLLNGVVIRMAAISKWALIVIGVLLLVDTVMKGLGAKKGVFDYINDALSAVSDKLFGALDGVKGLKEELAGDAKSPFGIPVNDFRELKGALQEIGLEMQNGIRRSAAELKTSLASIGLSGAVAQQITNTLRIRLELQDQKAFRDTELQLQRLQARFDEVGGEATAKRAAEIKANIEALNKVIDDNRDKVTTLQNSLFGGSRNEGVRLAARRALEQDAKALKEIQNDPAFSGLSTEGVFASRFGIFPAERAKERIEAAQQYNDLRDSIKAAEAAQLRLKNAFKGVAEADTLSSQIADLRKARDELLKSSFLIESQELLGSVSANLFDEGNRQKTFKADLEAAKALANIAANSNVLQQEAVQAAAQYSNVVTKNAIEQLEAERSLEETLNLLRQRRADLVALVQSGVRLTSEESDTVDAVNKKLYEQAVLLDDKLQQQKLLNAEQEREAKNRAQLANLRATGSTFEGIQFGLLEFQKNNSSLFDVGSQFAVGALDGFAQVGGQAIGELFNPDSNFELAEAAGQLALRLGTELATAVIKNLLSEVIGALLPGLAGSLGFTTGASALTTAGGVLSKAATGLVLSAGKLIIAAGKLAAANIAGVATATARGGKIGVNTPRVRGPMGAFAGAPGFARGGTLGKDHRDTIPAWLRPGEWVIRPEAVALYGDRLFQLLNRRQLNPSVLSGISSAAKTGSSGLVMPRRSGYATGGKVASSAPSGGTQTVVVANYYDEQTMDRSLAAGQQAQLRFARTKRSQYLASLGLTPGG